jgi:putative acetyltransferase
MLNPVGKSFAAVILSLTLLSSGCKNRDAESGFAMLRAERQITGTSKFPIAVDPNLVGTYPPQTKSGAGYFYDDVLEYRVWLHPDKGATPLNGDKDYFVAFAQYEPAQAFSEKAAGAEPPLALVRQLEWIDEPKHGQFIPKKGLRITEWQIAWLQNDKRTATSIQEFLKHHREADTDAE